MVILGAALIAMGVPALIGVSLWSATPIAIGGVFILSAVFGLARRHPEWSWCDCWYIPIWKAGRLAAEAGWARQSSMSRPPYDLQ